MAKANDPIGPRPYARLKTEPSVTTVIGEMAKPGLEWGSSKEAAMFAVYEPDEWQHLEEKEAVDLIRKRFKGVWDGRAAMGSVIHSVNEAWINGEDANLEALVRAVPSWEKQIDQKMEEADRYVDGLAKFWNDWSPSEFRSEDVVRLPGRYIGTRDLLGQLRGESWLLDLKTTAQSDAAKGIYGPEWALQLAAYNHATERVEYARDLHGKIQVSKVLDNGPADHCGIVHLRGDGEYVLFDVDAGADQFDAFLRLLDVHLWRKSCPNPKPLNPVTA